MFCYFFRLTHMYPLSLPLPSPTLPPTLSPPLSPHTLPPHSLTLPSPHTSSFLTLSSSLYSPPPSICLPMFPFHTRPSLLFQGTLRVLLVLLHDFPEFLCDYHFSFCDVIPPNCIQMRNLILSAFPRNMRLPDPFTPNLKVTHTLKVVH